MKTVKITEHLAWKEQKHFKHTHNWLQNMMAMFLLKVLLHKIYNPLVAMQVKNMEIRWRIQMYKLKAIFYPKK